jgi:trans-aconitate 2-methyltransferase
MVGPGVPAGEWDAETYDRISDPMLRMGIAVLDRLPLAGDERVLDAGCGSGRVTEVLASRLPHGSVVALDGSSAMVAAAADRLARFGDRVTYVIADLGRPLPLDRPVDALLSTATFHWVSDHDALFGNLAAVLRPGGRLAAQCGGAGNIESVVLALESVADGWRGPWHFATPEATTARLETAGFEALRCWLTTETVELEPGRPFESYLEAIVLRAHVERLPPGERAGFVHAVASRLPGPRLDYVRLNIEAVRGRPTG